LTCNQCVVGIAVQIDDATAVLNAATILAEATMESHAAPMMES
jgi:hypothetical protein